MHNECLLYSTRLGRLVNLLAYPHPSVSCRPHTASSFPVPAASAFHAGIAGAGGVLPPLSQPPFRLLLRPPYFTSLHKLRIVGRLPCPYDRMQMQGGQVGTGHGSQRMPMEGAKVVGQRPSGAEQGTADGDGGKGATARSRTPKLGASIARLRMRWLELQSVPPMR